MLFQRRSYTWQNSLLIRKIYNFFKTYFVFPKSEVLNRGFLINESSLTKRTSRLQYSFCAASPEKNETKIKHRDDQIENEWCANIRVTVVVLWYARSNRNHSRIMRTERTTKAAKKNEEKKFVPVNVWVRRRTHTSSWHYLTWVGLHLFNSQKLSVIKRLECYAAAVNAWKYSSAYRSYLPVRLVV